MQLLWFRAHFNKCRISFGVANAMKKIRKIASNYDINKGSILLLFNESDAKIARSWRNSSHSDHELDEHDPIAPTVCKAVPERNPPVSALVE
jgi:hypothetical protein